jgi:hypothetical protein
MHEEILEVARLLRRASGSKTRKFKMLTPEELQEIASYDFDREVVAEIRRLCRVPF